ncbi:hypothetical protein LUZ61_014253 [Rhynchospora tenuis]|uniref:Sulfotransferase n=1 Tax=Rhynchospora tenuis TaxID=198213 RepID=A0AAD5Z362_9POAL|nr:hypothetical protein LUZ61_014253 [Rhynchospora tenuis]
MSCPYSEIEENQNVVEQIVELCSFKILKDFDVNKYGKHLTRVDIDFRNAHFFRKGEAGDWKNHMTQEMAERLDNITKEKFKGSGLEI